MAHQQPMQAGPPSEARDQDESNPYRDVTLPRVNFFGSALQPVPVGAGPATGFFRSNYCDASPLDPASHTVAAVMTPEFLEFSAAQGNDLRSLFPRAGPQAPTSDPVKSPCYWCLCATRWAQAVIASTSHPLGERIVPRLILESTHERAVKDAERTGITREDFERFGVGGDGPGSTIMQEEGKGKGNVGR